jgi:hypothetical protein
MHYWQVLPSLCHSLTSRTCWLGCQEIEEPSAHDQHLAAGRSASNYRAWPGSSKCSAHAHTARAGAAKEGSHCCSLEQDATAKGL